MHSRLKEMIDMALKAKDLDEKTCPCGECKGTLAMGSKCHPGAAIQVLYRKYTATLILICSECEQLICEIAVAADSPAMTDSISN